MPKQGGSGNRKPVLSKRTRGVLQGVRQSNKSEPGRNVNVAALTRQLAKPGVSAREKKLVNQAVRQASKYATPKEGAGMRAVFKKQAVRSTRAKRSR